MDWAFALTMMILAMGISFLREIPALDPRGESQVQPQRGPFPPGRGLYQPRGINSLQLLFKEHFQSFADQYEAKHAIICGRFRIGRITEAVEKFILCGDHSQGVARIQCTNPDYKYKPKRCKKIVVASQYATAPRALR